MHMSHEWKFSKPGFDFETTFCCLLGFLHSSAHIMNIRAGFFYRACVPSHDTSWHLTEAATWAQFISFS